MTGGPKFGLPFLAGTFLVACLATWPEPTWAAPAWQGEEVLDEDGYLGLKPDLPFLERRAIARWGQPQAREAMGPGRQRWSWGAVQEEDRGLGREGLAVEAHATPLGWVIDWVHVGADRHPKPVVEGLAPHQAQAIRAHFSAQLDEGWALELPLQGIKWSSEALARAVDFDALTLQRPTWAMERRHSAQLHEARLSWGQGGAALDLGAMRQALAQAPGGGQLLTPAVVTHLGRPLGSSVPVHLLLPEHSVAWAPGPQEEPPGWRQEISLRLPEHGSVAGLRLGDLVVIRAPWEGFQAAAKPGQALLRLGRPSLAAAFPKGFVDFELWQGAPNPALRR